MEKFPGPFEKSSRKEQPTLNRNSESHMKIIFLYFRHRIYSFHKISVDDSKSSKLVEKIVKQGKILPKLNKQALTQNMAPITSELNIKKKMSAKDNVLVFNMNKSPPKYGTMVKKQSLMEKNFNQLCIQQQISPKGLKKYIIIGGTYESIRKALEERGYTEEPDPDSIHFEFKYVLFGKTAKYEDLLPGQMVNHFRKNTAVSRKIELMRNIRNLIYRGIDIDTFFPRCYDLGERVDLEDFIDDFKITKVMSVLRKFSLVAEDALINKKEITINNLPQVVASLNIMTSRIKQIRDIISKESGRDAIGVGKGISNIPEFLWEMINGNSDELKQYSKELDRLQKQNKISGEYGTQNPSLIKAAKAIQQTSGKLELTSLSGLSGEVNSVLKDCKTYYPQYNLNGSDNIWIMKPSGLSRGRGICCVNSLIPVLKAIKNQSQFIIQKYIENPLLIKNRKFDIRQWVIVTSITPLVIWRLNEAYLRFSALDYSTDDISNQYTHLTNNSITKYYEGGEEEKFKGNMWSREDFEEHLKKEYGRDIWNEDLRQKIDKILILALDSAKEIIEHRDNSYEIFGFDLMVDDDFNPWLIEINSSPAMDYSTEVTEKVVKEGLNDLIKVVVDRHKADPQDKNKINTGKYTLIHEGKEPGPQDTPNKILEF